MENKGLLVGTFILIAAMLTGCCSHDFKPATCEEPEICWECGETRGRAKGHRWLAPTCEEPQTCMDCGKLTGSAHGHEWSEATYEHPEICNLCGMTRGEKLTPVMSWGFEFLSEMGNMLVDINEAPMITEEGAYIRTSGSALKFLDGYLYYQDLTEQNGAYVFEDTRSPRVYEVANNDNILINGGSRSMRITERYPFGLENFVAFNVETKGFQTSESIYIPYSLLDFERGIWRYSSDQFLIYLKQ